MFALFLGSSDMGCTPGACLGRSRPRRTLRSENKSHKINDGQRSETRTENKERNGIAAFEKSHNINRSEWLDSAVISARARCFIQLGSSFQRTWVDLYILWHCSRRYQSVSRASNIWPWHHSGLSWTFNGRIRAACFCRLRGSVCKIGAWEKQHQHHRIRR